MEAEALDVGAEDLVRMMKTRSRQVHKRLHNIVVDAQGTAM
jgi:hypothetical protein